MNPSCRLSTLLSFILLIATAVSAHAHPGHDGHELTWDLRHLGEHPVATLFWLGIAVGASWCGWLVLKRTVNQRSYSLRGSQPSRGK